MHALLYMCGGTSDNNGWGDSRTSDNGWGNSGTSDHLKLC